MKPIRSLALRFGNHCKISVFPSSQTWTESCMSIFLFVTFQLDVFANQTSGGAVNITVIYNELYGALFELVDDTIWNTASLDREYQDAYNLLVIAYGDAGVITANVSQSSICYYKTRVGQS